MIFFEIIEILFVKPSSKKPIFSEKKNKETFFVVDAVRFILKLSNFLTVLHCQEIMILVLLNKSLEK